MSGRGLDPAKVEEPRHGIATNGLIATEQPAEYKDSPAL